MPKKLNANQLNSKSGRANGHSIPFNKNIFGVIVASLFTTTSYAQALVYDGTNAAGTAQVGEHALPSWLGVGAGEQGVIYKNSSNATVGENTNLEINYETGATPSFVIGGYSQSPLAGTRAARATGNTVTITQGDVNGSVYAGLAHLTQDRGDLDYTGDHSKGGADLQASYGNTRIEALNNNADIKENIGVSGSVHGGAARFDYISGNAISGETQSPYANGVAAFGRSMIMMTGSTTVANGSTASLGDGSTVGGSIYGATAQQHIETGDALGKTAIHGTVSDAYAYGQTYITASTNTVTANTNKVFVGQNAHVADDVIGGVATQNLMTGSGTGGTAQAVSGANAGAQSYIQTIGSTVSANGNEVKIGQGATVGNSAYAGQANLILATGDTVAGSATITGNAVTGTNVNASSSIFASDVKLQANSNAMSVEQGASVENGIYGGSVNLTASAGNAQSGYANGSATTPTARAFIDLRNTNLTANDNTVNFDGVLNGGNIYGGYAALNISEGTAIKADGSAGDDDVMMSGTVFQAMGNTVNIKENAQLASETTSLYGGYLEYQAQYAPSQYDAFTGNTLNFSARPVRVQTVANFQNYNFSINPMDANTGSALLTADDIVFGANSSNVSTGATTASTVNVVGIHSGNVLYAGDEFVLMNALNSMTGQAQGSTSQLTALQGISLLYDVQTTVDLDGKTVTAVIVGCDAGSGQTCPEKEPETEGPGEGGETEGPGEGGETEGPGEGGETEGPGEGGETGGGNGNGNSSGGSPARVNPQLKALSEGFLAGAQLITSGADFIANDAFAAIDVQNNQSGWSPFATMSAQSVRYNSGSHIKSNDILLAGGLSYQNDGLTTAVFAETGKGNYDTYNSFNTMSSVHGTGHTEYYGVGALGRIEFDRGFYADGSVRVGRNENKYDTQDLQNLASGEYAGFKTKGDYVSAHAGIGYIFDLSDKTELDIGAKYLWTKLSGSDQIIAGDEISFEAVNSHRARVEGTLSHQYSSTVKLNAGLAYEQEFDGEAKATTYKVYEIEAPSVKGGTGIVTLGANIKPKADSGLSFDIHARGYTGKREGVGVNLGINYTF